METGSKRCDHCSHPLPEAMRSDARYCNSACRSAHSRSKPEGATWTKGYWRVQSARKPRSRRTPVWASVSPVIAFLDARAAHSRSGATL